MLHYELRLYQNKLADFRKRRIIMTNIKAVVFDIDGTLVDRNTAFINYCNDFIDKYSSIYPYEGDREKLIEYMIKIDENGYGGLLNFIPRLRAMWELPIKPEDFKKERNELFGKYAVGMPRVHEILSTLKKKYKLGVITNGYSKVQRGKMETVGILDYFDDIIVSGEVGIEKPDKNIFFLSCNNLKVKPEETIYVGDYYPNDIAGAKNANITSIWINKEVTDAEYEGICIQELEELLEIL
jgi:putative hydrolase of the HAD superfamily